MGWQRADALCQPGGVRLALVGTDLCSVRRAGGLERALHAWAGGLASEHDVVLVDVAPPPAAPGPLPPRVAYRRVDGPETLQAELGALGVDLAVLSNRPAWRARSTKTHLVLHNYPSAWGLDGAPRAAVRRHLRHHRVSAVSAALARHTEESFGLEPGSVAVSPPPVEAVFLDQTPVGGAGILFPNRLMRKKGVELFLAVIADRRLRHVPVRVLDYTSPFLRGGDEHRAMRRLVVESRAALLPEAASRADLARRYAEADVVVSIAIEPEGLGLVPLEAQAVGVPVVTAGPGGTREATLPPNEHVEPTVDALVTAILSALGRGPAPGAASTVAERFSVAAATAALLAALA